MKSTIKNTTLLGALAAIVLGACSVNVGDDPNENDPSIPASIPPERPQSIDPYASWIELGNAENSFTQSELSQVGDDFFGALAAPGLRIFKFQGSGWIEITSQVDVDTGMDGDDYQLVIQSEMITSDTSLDFVIRLDSAPWDLVDNGNQGRSLGFVISPDGGMLKKLAFWDPYDPSATYDEIEYVEYVNGALVGQWYGSCGRPCGILTYTWNASNQRLEGIESNKRQRDAIRGIYCTAFSFADSLPLKKCQEGSSVSYLQSLLNEHSYELEVDGYFGHNTTFAVQHFQRTKNIRATGIVDFETWKTLTEGKTLPGRDINGDGVVTPNEITGR